MNIKIIISVSILAILGAFFGLANTKKEVPEFPEIPLFRLLTTPEKYDGKKVCAVGFLEIDKDFATLAICRDHLMLTNMNRLILQRYGKYEISAIDKLYRSDRRFESYAGVPVKVCGRFAINKDSDMLELQDVGTIFQLSTFRDSKMFQHIAE